MLGGIFPPRLFGLFTYFLLVISITIETITVNDSMVDTTTIISKIIKIQAAIASRLPLR